MVAQIADGDFGADEVGKSEPFLDDLLGFGSGGETWAVDDVDCDFGEQIDRDMPFDFAHLRLRLKRKLRNGNLIV